MTGLVCAGPSTISGTADGATPASLPRPALAAGGSASCALAAAGTVDCWGRNVLGQLGDGTTTNRSTRTTVPGLSGVAQVAMGSHHTCALLTSGTVKCWGQNTLGEVGDGTTTSRVVPTTVNGLTGVAAIAAGTDDTCALLTSGTVKCWGDNAYGELGNGTTTNRSTPGSVTGVTGATAITAGGFHVCVIDSAGVQCWGHNAYGQLGDGTTGNSPTPKTVVGLQGVSAISAGAFHTCALSTGTVKCWGYNSFGQVGDGTTTNQSAPTAVTGLSGVGTIAAGGYHTCALLNAGTVKCWGYNTSGQIGNGTTVNVHAPASVSSITGITQIAAGNFHSCALASNGTTSCWGNNAFGQIGDGTTTNRLVPTAPPVNPVASMLASLRLVNYYPHDHGWSQMWTNFDPTEIDHDFGVMRAMGANSVRVIIQAYSVGFPKPTATGMSELARIISLAHAHGMTAQLSLFDWFGDWSNISGSTTWAKAILAPYKSDPRISFVEIRNEIDVTQPAALKWAKTMDPIIHAAAGNLPVTISIPGNAPSNALQIVKQTFGTTIDFYDVHYYAGPSGAQSAFARDKATVAPSPLFIGEAGWSTGNGGSPSSASEEQKQSQFFTGVNAAAKANGLGVPSPWAFQDFTNGSLTWVGPTSNEYRFGLLRVDGSAKPAYAIERSAFAG